jgi:hypothetical protein
MSDGYQKHLVDWEGVALSISYCPDGSPAFKSVMDGPLAHLEISSLDGQPLPISETGYKSHFISAQQIEEEGGPVACAQAWLDPDRQAPEWKAARAQRRQLSLF